MDILFVLLFFILGLIFGSFFNVVGLRLPKQKRFANSRSCCPSCQAPLSWYELIPVFSYFIQKGTCNHCKQKISLIYPSIELVTGFLFMFSYIHIPSQFELITALLLISMLIIILVSDIRYMIIPDKILLTFLPFFIIMRFLQPLDPWWSSFVGGVGGFSIVALIIFISRGGMGAGDMKLFGVLGLVLGMSNVLLAFFLACIIGAIVGGLLLFFKLINKKQPIPFGPYIVVAALISYFYGEKIITWYLHFF